MRLCLLVLFSFPPLIQLFGQDRDPRIVQILREISSDSLSATVHHLASFGTRHTLSDTVSPTRGIGAARRWIKREFDRAASRSQGRMKVWYQETLLPSSVRVVRPVNVVNVLAMLRPPDHSSSDRMILVTGHYDSRATDVMDTVSDAPGANDDGSGTAVVLELARVLSSRSFNATIVFAALAGEEQGLLGAGALSQYALTNGWNVEAVLNNDMVGNTQGGDGTVDRTTLRVFSLALTPADTGAELRRRSTLGLENDGASRTLARSVAEVGRLYVPDLQVRLIYRLDRFLRGGDHRPFHERGFAAVRITEAREHYDRQHQNVRNDGGRSYGDLPTLVDAEYAARAARVNAASIASLAWAPAPPDRAVLDVHGLGYTTTIRWARSTDAVTAGYRVRWRETSSSLWQGSFATVDTNATLQILKDDFLFGIQAVDSSGNASLPAIPRP